MSFSPFHNPSKYAAQCTAAREACGAQGVILIVLNGTHGPGLAVQLPPDFMPKIPDCLRDIADMIEDLQKFEPN